MSDTPSHKNNQDINSEDEDYSPYAGVMKRGIASLIDLLLLFIPYMPLLFYFSPIPLSLINDPEYRLEYLKFCQSLPVLLSTQLLFFFYFTLQYRSKHQATLGMRLVDIKLTTEDSKKPSWTSLFLRYFLYILPSLSLVFLQKNNMIPLEFQEATFSLSGITTLILILMIALTNRKQTYYDMAAKTLVLQQPKVIKPPFVYAGLWRRIFSDVLDKFIVIALVIPMLFLLSRFTSVDALFFLGTLPVLKVLITLFSIPLVYSLPQLASKHQATLGMRAFNIKLMTTGYRKPSYTTLLLRYCIMFFLYPLSIAEAIPAAMILFTDRKQAYYDKMSEIIFVKTST